MVLYLRPSCDHAAVRRGKLGNSSASWLRQTPGRTFDEGALLVGWLIERIRAGYRAKAFSTLVASYLSVGTQLVGEVELVES